MAQTPGLGPKAPRFCPTKHWQRGWNRKLPTRGRETLRGSLPKYVCLREFVEAHMVTMYIFFIGLLGVYVILVKM